MDLSRRVLKIPKDGGFTALLGCNLLVTLLLREPSKNLLYLLLSHIQFGALFEAGLLFSLSPVSTGSQGYSTSGAEIILYLLYFMRSLLPQSSL